jgi:Flp pilus assembly protein TadG
MSQTEEGRVRTLSRISRFARERGGNVAIISAILLPVLIGFGGFGMETAWWYSRQRELQGAADIAAFDATLKRREGGTADQAKTVATADALTNGWKQPIGSITVNSPPTTGNYKNVQSVRVVLTENQPRFISAMILGDTPTLIRASSTATMRTGDPACILGLNTAAADTVQFWGNGSTSLFNCVVASNSTSLTGFHLGGSADLTVPCAYSSGGASYDSGLDLTDADCPTPVTNHPATLDPYADLPAPSFNPASCTTLPANAPFPNPLPGGCYNGLSVTNGTGDLNLTAGATYIINGSGACATPPCAFKTNGSSINGNGVMIYLTNGATLDIAGNTTLNLKAQTSGTYGGVLFFSDRTQAWLDQKVNGTSTSIAEGAFYFPSQKLTFLGNFAQNQQCLQIVADQVKYTGSAVFQNNCTGKGVRDLTTVGNIKLVE